MKQDEVMVKFILLNEPVDPVIRLALVGKLLMRFCRLIAPRNRSALGINSWQG